MKYTLRPVAAALGHAWVASRAGVSRRAVSAWLDGSRVGSIEFAERVAKACGYSVIISAVQTSDYGSRLRLMNAAGPRRPAATPVTPRGPLAAFSKRGLPGVAADGAANASGQGRAAGLSGLPRHAR